MSELLKKYKKDLGEKIETRVINKGQDSFSIKVFENGFLLKRANRGEIALDRFDAMIFKDMITRFEKKHAILRGLSDA